MSKIDNTIDKLTSMKIKSMGLDEPSDDFTLKIMHTIVAEQPVYSMKQRNYWWLLSFVPIFLGISYYILFIFGQTIFLSDFATSLLNMVKPSIGVFSSLLNLFKQITIPPMFLIGFIAMLSLLTLEEIISSVKHRSI